MAYGNANLLPVDASTFEGGTSSWPGTGTNSTIVVQSAAKLSGTYALRVTATAAGSAVASSPRVAVTAGLEYVARVPVGIATSIAGLTTSATIEWWTAASGGTQLSTTTGAVWNISSTVGFWAANYPVVTGTAPVGATHALVRVTVNNLAASGQYLIDDVYFGAAVVSAGNAYGYNTASIEQDTSGWRADAGTTLARGLWGLVTGMGYYALEATSSAAGSQELRTNSFINVLPGKEYTSYVSVYTPSVATTWYAEFRWYDSALTQLGGTVQTAYAVSQSVTTRLGVTGIAPAGASYCKVFIRPQATAAGQTFVLEDARLIASPNLAGNLLTYTEYSAEGTLPALNLTNGTASLYQLTSPYTDGFFVVKATPTETGLITGQLARLVPVTPGTTYQVKATIYRRNSDPAQAVISSVRVRIDWFDADGNLFQADNADQFYSTEQVGDWYAQTNSETRTCPEGASYAKPAWEVSSDNPLVSFWVIDNFSFLESAPEYTLETSNENGCVTLTVANAYAPTTNNAGVTIKRVDESGNMHSMRGYGRTWDLAPNPYAPIVVEDYEAPLASRVWYSVQWSDAGGTTKGTRLLTQTVDAPVLEDGDYAWFKSPGLPALNTTVLMEAPLTWSREARSSRFNIVGRKNPVHVTGMRAGRTSSITVLIWDPEANELFNSLLDAGTAALVQAMPGYGIDGNLYVSIGDIDVEPLDPDAREPGWRWTLAITEVDRPDGGLEGSAASTWQDILDSASYPTWEELFAAHDSWTTVLTEG